MYCLILKEYKIKIYFKVSTFYFINSMVKTDQTSLSDAEKTELSKHVFSFMDSMRVTSIAFVVSFVAIVFFIVGPFRPDSTMYVFFIRCLVCIVLIYAVFMSGQAILKLGSIKGIFSLNSMQDVRVNLYMCVFFTILLIVLIGLLFRKYFV